MQTTLPGELSSRLAYYTAAQYVEQMKEGDDYKQLTTVDRDLRPERECFPKVG